MQTDWTALPAHALREAIQNGDATSVAVTQACLDRIDAVDDRVQAFVEVWREEALARAAAVDEMAGKGIDIGPLGGVPIGLKDVLCTRLGHTTCCSHILEGYRSPFDGTAVLGLEDAGAVFLGKLNMDEFAMGSSTENSARQTTRNPWNLECVPGGSSGGSAAAVAARECPISLGSDTGGSIRQPASLCGVMGMKPTYGRVSRWGLVAFASSLDQIGPFTRNTKDMALTLNAICGHDPRDSTSIDRPMPDLTEALGRGVEGLRIGLPTEYFAEGLSAEVRASVEAALAQLESAGASLVEVSMPHAQYAVAVYYIICTAEASANLARFDGVRYGFRAPEARSVEEMYRMSKSQGFGPEVQRRIMLGTYVLSSGYYDAYYLKAQKARRLIREDFDRAWEHCDIIATPTAPTPAFPIGAKTDDPLEMYLSDIYTISLNLAGGPGISVPCGTAGNGLPIGLQFMGQPFDEPSLIQAADAYERLAEPIGTPALT